MNQILLFIGLVIILCLTIKPVGKKLPFPTLLIFIALGMLLGVNGPTHIDFSDYALTENRLQHGAAVHHVLRRL